MSPINHGNSATILNVSTLPWLGDMHTFHTFISLPSYVQAVNVKVLHLIPVNLLGFTVIKNATTKTTQTDDQITNVFPLDYNFAPSQGTKMYF